ncbi:hypothetical protein HDU87_008290 [Geranomyces variabilis]|uniref:Uncharacterized protein n=1 Tax=Geranomyces variabilis TaxID=109894 RepID=A0AAD5XM67_9FUNG|nr:hypothetical protein HDU87_008290 [Geranomyces variabilis]
MDGYALSPAKLAQLASGYLDGKARRLVSAKELATYEDILDKTPDSIRVSMNDHAQNNYVPPTTQPTTTEWNEHLATRFRAHASTGICCSRRSCDHGSRSLKQSEKPSPA